MSGEFETNPEVIKAELAEVDKKSAELNDQRTNLYEKFQSAEITEEERNEADRAISAEMTRLDQRRYQLREALGIQSLVEELEVTIDLLLETIEGDEERESDIDEVIDEACFSVFGQSAAELTALNPNFQLVITEIKKNHPSTNTNK